MFGQTNEYSNQFINESASLDDTYVGSMFVSLIDFPVDLVTILLAKEMQFKFVAGKKIKESLLSEIF